LPVRFEADQAVILDWRIAGLPPKGSDRPEECERFESFAAWVVDRMEDLIGE
jgi:hypothetical protein